MVPANRVFEIAYYCHSETARNSVKFKGEGSGRPFGARNIGRIFDSNWSTGPLLNIVDENTLLNLRPHIVFLFVLLLGSSPGPLAFASVEDVETDGATGTALKEEEMTLEPGPITLSEADQQALAYYEDLIKELETRGGVYDSQLSEVLVGLGGLYQGAGMYQEAVNLFERAYHIARVNSGLYALEQLAILEKLIESNRKLKNWQAVDQNYHNLLWISKRHYGDNSTELLSLIERVGRWHLQARELLDDSEAFAHALQAEELFSWSVDIITADGGPDDLRLINPLYGIALTNYHIATQVSSLDSLRGLGRTHRGSNRARRLLEEQRARDDMIIQSFITGREALRQIVEIHATNPILPVSTHAMALTHLADWFLLFNKRNSASETYQQAYNLMQSDGMPQKQIDQLFGQPRTLPAIRFAITSPEDELPENPPYVLASFDVSPSGKARNIQIIESSEEDDVSYRRKAKRSIAATRFRPRYENGQPVLTTGVNLRYVFTDQAEE